jgi:predicted nucleic acid-binding protein
LEPADFAANDIPFLLELPLLRAPMTASLARSASAFVTRGLTGYDATYAALARETDADWWTFDGRAAAALEQPSWVKVLSER